MRKNQLELLHQAELFHLPVESARGRDLVSRGRKIIDFCNTNYLGFDFSQEVHRRGVEWVECWGLISGWSRMELDPSIYGALERKTSEFLGVKDTILSHTITITNFSIIPWIVGKGVILADEKVHTVVWEACRLARDHGSTLARFKHQDMSDLEEKLKAAPRDAFKLIAVDGVYSISTEVAPLREMAALAEKYDAYIYVDDAHGFGVLGESPTRDNPYGVGGSGVVRHLGVSYDRVFYVSSFGKAFCNHTAFFTVPDRYERDLRAYCMQYLYSAPPSPYQIGCADALLDLNRSEGEKSRARLRELVARFTAGLRDLGLKFRNERLVPAVFVEIGELPEMMRVATELDSAGIIAGLRAYPVVPETECGMRFGITALHTDEQIDKALTALESACNGSRAAIA